MGWNTGYTIMESTVIGAYDLGVLTKPLLAVLLEPYRNSDIDSGGCNDLKTKDGKGVHQVVIETMGMEYPKPPRLSDDRSDWSGNDWVAHDNHLDKVYEKFRKATEAFGW